MHLSRASGDFERGLLSCGRGLFFFFFHISPVCTCFGVYFREGLYLYSARYTNFYEIREVMVVNRALINSKVKCEPEKIT